MNDITLGQYYPAQSILHKLDPRVKLLGTLIYLISLFVFDNIWGLIIATVFLCVLIYLSKVPFRFMIRGMRFIIVILAVTAVLNLIFTPGETLLKLGPVNITVQGVWSAAFMFVRLTYVVTGASIMTLTTTPNRLTDGMEKGLSFLKIFKVPVHEIAMIMSIALRFIPILSEEAIRIKMAQTARGADFESGNFLKKAGNMIPVLVPLFVSAFRRASDLSLAMEARCYHPDAKRTRMHPLCYARRDYVGYIMLAVYFATIIVITVMF